MDSKMTNAHEEEDSEEEKDRIEEEKEVFTTSSKFVGTESPQHVSALVLCLQGNPEALTKIIFD